MNKSNVAFAKCIECPLFSKPLVRSYGPLDADLIVVGEGPGMWEASMGRPFIGDSGDLLRKTLAGFGVDPERVYYTNATLCYPDEGKDWLYLKMSADACIGRLKHALLQHSGETPVLALGKVAQYALGIEEQDKWEREALTGKWTVAGLHPAAVLREPEDATKFIQTVRKVVEPLTAVPTFPSYQVIKEPVDLPSMVEVVTANRITYDVETTSLDWTSGRIFLSGMGLFYAHKTKIVIFSEEVLSTPQFRDWLDRVLKAVPERLWGHNIKFDMLCTYKQFDTPLAHGGDTLVATNILKPNWYLGLKDLSRYYFNADDYEYRLVKSFLKTIKKTADRTYDKVPRHDMEQYLALDLWYTGLLSYELERRLKEVGRWEAPYLRFEVPLSNTLTQMEADGVPIDLEQLDNEISYMQAQVEAKAQQVILRSAGKIQNPNSVKQVSTFLWDDLKAPRHGAKGKPARSTQEAVLIDLKDKRGFKHPFIDELLAYRRVQKLLSSYLLNAKTYTRKIGGVNKVHPTYNQTKVRTGRLSAEKPPIQTQPKENFRKDGDGNFAKRVKNLYIAPPAYKLVGADFSQAEMRVATVLSCDPWLMKAYASGEDVHSMACDMIWGAGNWDKNHRTKEKNVMFGLLYGGQLDILIAETGLPSAAVALVHRFFYGTLTGLLSWREDMFLTARDTGRIITPYFNRLYDFTLMVKKGEHELRKIAVNYPVQGTASQITMEAAHLATSDLRQVGAKIIIPVHDQLIALCPEAEADNTSRILQTWMSYSGAQFSNLIPWETEVSTAKRWGELK